MQYLSSSVIALPTNNQNCCTNPKWWIRLQCWFTRLWRSITKTNSKNILKRLHASIQTPVLVTCATPWSFQIPLTRESLIAAIFDVKTQIEAVEQWKRHAQYLVEGEIRLQEYKSRIVAIETQLASVVNDDFYSRFYTEYHQLQVQIFELSWQYLQLVALQRKDEIIESIKTYIGYLNNDWDAKRKLERNSHTIYRDVSLLFPVFTSTLHSVRNLFPFLDNGCIDQLIVDEAGMAQLHLVFPALARCNKALIVGDPRQLEPVMNLSRTTLEQYCKQAFNARGLSEDDYDRYSPTAISTATAYHRAAGASPNNLDLGNGILLKEHQRCVEPIITFCSRICNYGLIVRTPDKPSLLGSNLIVTTCNTNHSNLQSTHFQTRIICNYNYTSTRINCN